MHIAIVAGEASGDILGAGLITALRQYYPDARFSGIGGDKMCALGFESLFAMERLSVMGIVEPLKRLPELLAIRKSIKNHCLQQPVDVFIGIDSPDFNLNIEGYLRARGIATVHYVSPSVWAWRQGRIKGIRKAVDLMLTLLPFEADFYRQHQVAVAFVGHPLADDIAIEQNPAPARQQLAVPAGKRVISLLPGSRAGEVALMGELFLQVASKLQQHYGNCHFLLPAANAERYRQLEQMLGAFSDLDVKLLQGQSHAAMAAADAVLLASGTTALEAMLFKKPMVVAYKMAPLSFFIISRLVRSAYISLPNLLADKPLVPELIQQNARPDTLFKAVCAALDGEQRNELQQQFTQLHQQLRVNASHSAAAAIHQLLCQRT